MNVLLTTDCFFHPLDHVPTYHAWLLNLIRTGMLGSGQIDHAELIHEAVGSAGCSTARSSHGNRIAP